MARIAGVDIPREKRLEVSLTYVYGVGPSTAKEVCRATAIDPDTRVRDLTDEEVIRLRSWLDAVERGWAAQLTSLKRHVEGDRR